METKEFAMQLFLQFRALQCRALQCRIALFRMSLLLALAFTGFPARAADENPYILQERVDEVRIVFAATDALGHGIKSLRSSDVAVADNGWIVRNFRSFRPAADMPLDLVLLLDTSDSAQSELAAKIAEITNFLEGPEWEERDRVSVLVFGGERSQLLCLRNCRGADMRGKLSSLHADGLTPLYDALLQAAGLLQGDRDPEFRPAMVLLSDGQDTFSRSSMADAMRAAADLEAPIYAINQSSRRSGGGEGDAVLGQLATGTGGLSFGPGENLTRALRTVLEDLRCGYVLTYRLPEHRRGEHSVRLLPTGNATLRFRSRHSYEQSSEE